MADWPCQRLRIGISLVLFYVFETLIGRQLGQVIAIVALGLGLACLASAGLAIKRWKLAEQLSAATAGRIQNRPAAL